MAPESLGERLIRSLQGDGLKAKIISVGHVTEAREAIEKLHEMREFDENFYGYLNKWINYEVPSNISNVRSIIIISIPQPITQVSFEFEKGSFVTCVPPTYNYHEDENVIASIEKIIGIEGYKVEKANLPKKTLAVRSGLAVYGRNNITYVSGMGSFHRLMALYSDMPCDIETWKEPEIAEACRDCDICAKACPTNAIDTNRFLLHAELCLTYFNENEDDIPDWIDASWHNALVGCLKCQLPCPMNREYVMKKDKIPFDVKETDMILRNVPSFEFDPKTIKKLERMGLSNDISLISRNLKLLLNK